MKRYSGRGYSSGRYVSRYSARRYSSGRNSMKRNLILIGIVAVVIIALLGLIIGYFVKVNKEREAQQLAYRQEGIEYFEQEAYEKALDCFQKALGDSLGSINDVEMDICFYKARAQYELGDAEGALETYDAVIEYNESPEAYFLRGNLYYSMGEEAKALADYDKAVEKETADYDLYIAIYEILASKDKVEQGQEILNKALEIKGDKATDKVKKGRIHFLLGDHEKAVALLEEAAKEEPEGYYYLFLVYDSLENSEKALENLNTYMDKETNLDSYKLYEMGTSLLNKGMYESAAECYNQALDLKKIPNKQEIMKNLVVTYEKNRDFTSAKEVMKQYIEEYPEDEEALREYTFLETR